MTGNRYISKFIGTFCLVFAGCGAIVVNDTFGGVLGHLGVCIAFGLVVMAMVYATGNVSGAHINPAVTLGFFCCRPVRGPRDHALHRQPAARCDRGSRDAAVPVSGTHHAGSDAAGDGTDAGIRLGSAAVVHPDVRHIERLHRPHMEKGIMAGVAVGGTVTLNAMFGGPGRTRE